MQIMKITPRRDGKFLVALHYDHGVNRRRVMTAEELRDTEQKIREQKEQAEEYRRSKADGYVRTYGGMPES